jgi:hypothetical protein
MPGLERCNICPIPRMCAGVRSNVETMTPKQLAEVYTGQYLEFLKTIDARSVANGYTYTREAGKITECLESNPNCIHRTVFPPLEP